MFVLRPEIQKDEKADFYQEILNEINEVQYHYDESFKQPKRKGRWHRYYFEKLPRLRVIDSFYWNVHRLKLNDDQRAYFQKVIFWDKVRYRWDHYYQFAMPELFEIAVQPNIIDKVKLQDEELEREIAFIDDYLYSGPNAYRLAKIKGGWYKNWYSKAFPEKKKYINPLKNTPLYKVLDEYC